MSRYLKLTITLREDLYDIVTHVMKATGVSRSSAIALIISHVDLEDILPPAYLRQHPELLNRVYPVERDDHSTDPK